MSAHIVSPPAPGTSTARRTEPSAGLTMNEWSLCQMFLL